MESETADAANQKLLNVDKICAPDNAMNNNQCPTWSDLSCVSKGRARPTFHVQRSGHVLTWPIGRDATDEETKTRTQKNLTVANWAFAETTHVVGSKSNSA